LIKYAGPNEPRFDHRYVNGEIESLGLLIEEQRVNSALRSQEFNLSPNQAANASISPNAAIAPDGTLTADKLVEDGILSQFKRVQQGGFSVNGDYTVSCFFKAGEVYKGYIQLLNTTNAAAFFDLNQGIITGGTGTIGIIAYPNGWYRVYATNTYTNETPTVYIVMVDANGQSNYTGNGANGMYVWGLQVEQGSFPTSYIPTEGSTKTRTPDNAYIEGTQFNQFYNLSEGTVFCSFSSPTPYGRTNATPFVFSINRNTIGWGHYVSSGGSSISLFRDPSDVNIAFLNTAGSPTIGITDQERKLSVGYKLDDFVQYVNIGNGVISERTDSLGQVRTDINAFAFNPQHSGLQRFGGHIKNFSYYPTKFTNTQIRNLAL